MFEKATRESVRHGAEKSRTSVNSQLNYDGAGFYLVHFHEGETFCAGKPLFGFVVLEFKEDSCAWKTVQQL